MPKVHLADPKQPSASVARDLRECVESLKKKPIKTGDESLVYGYDPEIKGKSSQ